MEGKGITPMDPPPPYPGMPGVPVSGEPYNTQPPPPGFYMPTPSGAPMATVVTVVSPQNLGPYSVQLTCPKCQALVMTSTKPQFGLITYLAAGLCVVFGCWFGCCLIPFCMNDMQDIEHHCPNCKSFIGIYRRL